VKYLQRQALAARINDVVAAATLDPKASTRLGGFALRSSPECIRGEPTDEDKERVRAALGEDAAASRILRFRLSGEKRLADGLALKMGGARLARFKANPVVLHGHWRGPVGHSVVWTANSSDEGNRMLGLVAMLPRDLSQALDGGFSWALGELAHRRGHAASIGFDVLLAQPAPADVRAADPWAMDVDEWELIEWSLVKIPMDPDAVLDARAAGVDGEVLAAGFGRMLDELQTAGIDRDSIERAWAAASGTRAKVFAPPPARDTIADLKDASTLVRDALRAAFTGG
jgi:hypothetical protein